jgi:hypothetical protein
MVTNIEKPAIRAQHQTCSVHPLELLYCFVRRPTYVHQPDAMLIVPNLGVYAYLSADLAVESPASAGLSPT